MADISKILLPSGLYYNFKDSEARQRLETISGMVSDSAETYTGSEVPTLSNYPTSTWPYTEKEVPIVGEIYTQIENVTFDYRGSISLRFYTGNGYSDLPVGRSIRIEFDFVSESSYTGAVRVYNSNSSCQGKRTFDQFEFNYAGQGSVMHVVGTMVLRTGANQRSENMIEMYAPSGMDRVSITNLRIYSSSGTALVPDYDDHIGDMFVGESTSVIKGSLYRFEADGNSYKWQKSFTVPTKVSYLENDSGYITENYFNNRISYGTSLPASGTEGQIFIKLES